MKRSDVTEAYYYNSQTASTISRGLLLSGVGLVWLFRVTDNSENHVPGPFWPALAVFILGLAIDLTQYTWATIRWGLEDHRLHKAGKKANDEVSVDLDIPAPQKFCFYAKLIATVVGYVLFGIAIASGR